MDPAVVQSFTSALHLAPQQINFETSQSNTPQWDSLGHLRLILELEQNLGVRFRSQDIPTMTSVARIEEVVASLKRA